MRESPGCQGFFEDGATGTPVQWAFWGMAVKTSPTLRFQDGRSLALDLQRVLSEASPEILAGRAFREDAWRDFSPARILCTGKAACGLAAAAGGRWPGAGGLVYAVGPRTPMPEGFEFLRGDHPFPSERNAAATARVRRWLEGGRGPVLACVSGGTSSLLVEPRPPRTLEEKLRVTGELWRRGASIRELNAVRASLSAVKAGGLLSSALGWPVRTAVWSDVGPRDGILVGSAPTIPWMPRPPADLVAARYGLPLPRPLPPPPMPRTRSVWRVLFDGLGLRRAAAARLREKGFRVAEFAQREGESAQSLAARIARRWAAASGPGPLAFVGNGEAVVAVAAGTGRGGRCSHLAAAVALALTTEGSARPWAFAALATDGVDGTAGGGAFADQAGCPVQRRLDDALRSCDTASLWSETGGLLPASPTGNNLRDLWVLAEVEP